MTTRAHVGRRLVAIALVSAIAFLGSPSCDSSGPTGANSPRPNVVLFIADDLRAPMPFAVMPRARELFREQGITFTQAFATTPQCCPSRSSMLTGRYAHNHGITNNIVDPHELDPSQTLQHVLSQHGYHTAIFGKYLNNWTGPPPDFDDYVTYEHIDYFGGAWDDNGTPITVDEYATTYLQEQVLAFLRDAESRDSEPWFLLVGMPAPHRPAVSDPRDRSAPVPSWTPNPAIEEPDRADKPPWIRAEQIVFESAALRRAQLRTMMGVDRMLGAFADTLVELGEDRRTLTFFVSDNGVSWGEHDVHGKKTPYDYSVKVPLMMRWPGRVESGTDDRLVANVDIAATVYDAAQIAGLDTDGESLLGEHERTRLLLEYETMAPTIHDPMPTWAALRGRDWKFVVYYDSDGDEIFTEYYDLARDPWELDNLFRTDPGAVPDVAPLREELASARSCSGSSCP